MNHPEPGKGPAIENLEGIVIWCRTVRPM